jgi:Holliday junction resolvase
MTVSILQSNYIPWKGYFDIIAKSDVFVIYDEVQFTRRDWRNRNLIKSNDGLKWLTIPVIQDNYYQKIFDTKVLQGNWIKKHKSTLQANYAKAPYFKEYKDSIFEIYDSSSSNLSEINRLFIEKICAILAIETKIIDSRELNLEGDKVERLIDACKKLNATKYLSGPAAKNYMNEGLFNENNIELEWMDYSNYKEYNQLYPPFEHGVSILDLIFNEGPNARSFFKY